jgi:transcription elongation GreA/GreB family factor
MKADLIRLVRDELQAQLSRLVKAAREAHEAATDPGSKAESKYDTRNLEQSYLAVGQARQVEDLAESVRIIERMDPQNFQEGDEIACGALVKVRRAERRDDIHFLMSPAAGGLEIVWQSREITLLSPGSPLYAQFLGKRVGEKLDMPRFDIVSIS